MKEFLYFVILPYLAGTIPSGLIIAKLFGYGDIRKIGSGNIGATNVLRTGNKWIAALTLLLDGLKGFVACKVAALYFLHNAMLDTSAEYDAHIMVVTFACLAGLLAIIGHIFPVWLKFKGGKGVATAIGAIFALNPVAGACIIAVWLITFFFTRISSLSALTGFFFTALACEFPLIGQAGYPRVTSDPAFVYFMCVTTMMIFLTHRENIERILRGEEHKWSKK